MAAFKHPVTIIFGAGATRGALEAENTPPPPLDTDFFDIANQIKGHGTPTLAKRVLKDVWNLYGTTNSIGLESYFRDLETRAIIGAFAKTANQPKNWNRRVKEMTELIRRVFAQTTVMDGQTGAREPRESVVHKHILDSLEAGDTIITFNYDLLIEESFSSAAKWNPIDGYGINTSGRTKEGWTKKWLANKKYEKGDESCVKLLKLHGSLNWEPSSVGIKLKPRPYLVSTRNKKTRYEKVSILAPGWNKRIDKNPYRRFWRSARLRL